MKNCDQTRQQTCDPVINCFDHRVCLLLNYSVTHVFEIQIDADSYSNCFCCHFSSFDLVIDFAIVFGCCYKIFINVSFPFTFKTLLFLRTLSLIRRGGGVQGS